MGLFKMGGRSKRKKGLGLPDTRGMFNVNTAKKSKGGAFSGSQKKARKTKSGGGFRLV